MYDRNFRERVDTSANPESPELATNRVVVNSDPFADKSPVDAPLLHETPMGGIIDSVDQVDVPLDDDFPRVAAPLREIPMGGPLSVVVPMNETIVHDETIPYTAPVVELIVDETLVRKPILSETPLGITASPTPTVTNTGSLAALLSREESEHFRTRWNDIQGKFVDEPRSAVQQADTLVSEVIGQITQMFSKEHLSLESQWNQGNDVSTEDLRKALQRYRSFFNRLVV